MRGNVFWGAVGALLCLSGPVAAQQSSLCAPGERVLFSCSLQQTKKLVSLCTSQNLSPTSGYLQYRFGVPGKVELDYPPGKAFAKGRLGLVRTQFLRSASYGVEFSSKGYDYALSYVASGPDPKDDSYVLSVTKPKSDTPLFSDSCDKADIHGKDAFYPLEPLAKKLGVKVLERDEEN